MRFVHDATGARVVFGAGRRTDVSDELALLGQRPLVIATASAQGVAGDLLAELTPRAADRIDGVRRHVPVGDAEQARRRATAAGADCMCAVGGGSAIGLAKAVALTSGLPILAVPTTYSGSEMTPVWGLTEDALKTTGRNPVVAPRTIVYDPELTLSLSAAATAASGLNAVAHCVDALWALGRGPLTDAMAHVALAHLDRGLRACVADGDDRAGRDQALVGAWLAGATFAVAGSSLHHKLCHALGGRFDLPHAETHAAVLPWTTGLALRHLPEAGQPIARALAVEDPLEGLVGLAAALGAPTSLGALGLTEAQAVELADDLDPTALATPFALTRDELRELLRRATAG